MTIILVFLTGSAIMSFLMHVAEAQQLSLSALSHRSKCQTCQQTLQWQDLVPIVSYILLKGRCRYCQTSIPRQLFIAEIFGGFIAIMPFICTLYIDTDTFYIIAFILLALAFNDIQYLTVPHRLLVILFLSNYLRLLPFSFEMSHFYLMLGLILSSFCLQRYIGMGDFKLFFVLSIFLPVPFTLFIIWFTFPIGLLLIPAFKLYHLFNAPFVPLVPAICSSFICVSLCYPLILNMIGGLI